MTTSSLVFIDARVSGYENFINDLPSGAEVVVLYSHTDGLEQIAAYLSGRTDIAAIHVLSHGSQGALYLGNTRVDSDYLNNHSAQLAGIGNSLIAKGDILLYGCNVAQGDVGLQFIQSLAHLTGADVAASVDTTGSTALGGNSGLEAQSGEIQTLTLDTSSLDKVLAVNTAPTFMVGDGTVTTNFGPSTQDYGYGVTVQADGKILVAGSSDGSFALVRYNSDGSLDTSFNSDDKVTTEFYGNSVTVQADGKILVAGYSDGNSTLVRYNSDGSLDTSFSDDGMLATEFYGNSVTVQADGKILVAGYSDGNSTLVRYNSDGSLDTSFSDDGMLATEFHDNSVTVQADGKILIAGTVDYGHYEYRNYGDYYYDELGNYFPSYEEVWISENHFALVRYNSDGSLDTSFGSDGKVTSFASNNASDAKLAVQADGKFLIAGTAYNNEADYLYWDINNSDIALVRYNSDGSLDTSFGGYSYGGSYYGTVITNIYENDTCNSITLQTDGKILIVGSSDGSSALVRYNSDGSLDTSFSGDGILTTNFSGNSVTVQTNGKILVAGSSYNGSNSDFALARYNSDGSLDTSFDLNTSLLGGSMTYTENAPAVVLDSDVQIYDAELAAVGYGNAVLTLARHGGAQAEDQFSGAGIVAGQSSGDVSVGGTTVGIYTWNTGTLRIVFNSNATQELLNQTAQAIRYQNTSDNPANSIQIDWTFSDGNTGSQGAGGSLETTDSTTVNITAVNDAPTGNVTITGTAAQGQTLIADTSTLNDVDGFLGIANYQWKANGIAITGATGSTYTLTQTEVGKTISVTASYIDSQGTAEAVTSSATTAVANVNDAPTGVVTLIGTAAQGQTLTAANTLADVDGLGTIAYQWKANGSTITGATGSTYTLGQADVGKSISVTASYTDGQGTAEAVTSAATATVANVNDAPTGNVTLSGTATQGQTLTAANNLADADGFLNTIGYQWKANGTAITGATGSTYTLTQNEVGKTVSVTASYTDGQGTAEAVTSVATTTVTNVNDTPTGTVTLTGTAAQGQTLTASNTLADVDGLGNISYQWNVNGSAISGASGSTYTLGQTDVGKTISVTASYTDGQGTTESVTSSTTVVANINDTPTGTVTLTGTATQGQTLTAANTLADVDGLGTVSYQWKANGSAITGATGSTYTLSQADVGKTISVTASYTDGQGTAESVTSSTTVVANINDTPTGTVTLTGTATQGQTLTAANTLADVDGLGTVSYQWKANGSAITGATGSTYTLSQADVGKTISVTASYTDGQGTAEAVTSSATTAVANVNDAPTGTVTITGTATQGQTLTAANTLADVDGLGSISYQWKANGTAITGATGTTYTLSQADVGKTISVTASYTDGQGTAEAVTSSATTAVANVNDAPTGAVTVTGTATQGQTLTAANTLADVDGLGTVAYQWNVNGTAITGATGTTYTLGQGDVGKTISVTASYTDGKGTAEAVTSAATTAVANVNDTPTGTVTLTGTAAQGQTLTASNTLADVDGLGTVAYQWNANGSPITGATDTTYTLGQGDVGKTISVTASYTDGKGTAEAITSSTTTAVANVNDAPTGAVTLIGTATEGQTLTAANTLADIDGLGTISYQWKANGSAITGATGTTYTLGQADVGKTISVTASYTDGQGTAEAVTSAATTAVANVNDAPTGTVTLTGTATQGQTLTAANTLADADGLGTVSYQWKANGSAITGATGSTYTLGQAEVGKTISVTASYTDGQGTTEAVTSSATTAVANVNDTPTGAVTLTGTATQGQTLTAANTLADVDGLGTVTYQWKANGSAITGATGTTYTLGQAEVGKTISVTASYTDGQGTAEAVTSAATTAVANVNDAPTGTVTLTGTATQGQTLTAANTLADVDGLGTVSYQWQANGAAITGATGSTYTLGQADVGKTISVTASYTDGQGTVEAVTSAATTAVANVNDAPTGTVTLTGTATQGQTLTAANTLADVDGLGTVSYQWKANGSAITGANGTTYTLGQADVGKTISVTASYTDGQGTAEAVTSAATTAVANVNDAPTGAVTLTGTATQGQTLTAANTLADVDGLGTVTYQWKANGSAITGATGTTYTLGQGDVGKTISVTASYTDGQGTAEAVTSAATTAVANVNDAPTGAVTLTGTTTQGQTLTAANTLADVDGLGTVTYQWKANGSAITGATGTAYTLGQGDVGKTISVTASYTDGQGTTEAVTSAATTAVANVNDAPTGTVTLTGTATQGQTLTAANTLADVDGLGTVTYQWKANGSAITGATGTTYTLGQADVGKTISVTANYTDGQGTVEAVTSAATTAVANVNDAPTGTVTLTGTATQGQTLTAANTLADVDGLGTVTYQWKANGSAITGATGTTYTLGQADVGKTISVTASYTDGQGTAEAITSSTTTAVANVNDAPTGAVTLIGTATEGQTLTAANTLADIDGLGTVSYQWLRGANAISGATASTYTLTASDANQSISVRASYTDGQGTAEAVTSASVTPVVLEPGVVFGNAEPGQLTTTEAGGTDRFTVALRAAPRGDVTLTFTLSDASEAVFSASGTATHSITFTADNWVTPQTVVLLGVDDKPNDGDVAYTISTSVSSEDLRYDGMRSGSGLPVANLIGQTIDNDAPDEQYGDAGGVVTADLIRGGNGASDLYGLSGRDVLHGNNGDDRLYGGYGDDVLYGNADNDNLEGDQGNDKLDGGTGDDTLNGGTGNDTLNGQAGNDNLLGDVGQDTLLGGDGNDTLNGGVDADSMNGGNGADVYYIDNAADVVSDNGTDGAIDTLYIMAYLSGGITLGAGIDNGTLDDQAGKGNLKGNASHNALKGNASDNVLDGGTGNDTLDGGAGVDNLTGGAGHDSLQGGLGNDVLYSGDGDDVVDAGEGNDLIIGGDGAGNDKYVGGAGIDTVKYTSATAGITVDLTKGTASSRTTTDTAKIGSDTLIGIESVIAGNYNDVVNGSAAANTLRGESGNDTLDGKAGNDALQGGAGNDRLIGGAGKDSLTGGAGNDVFKFNTLAESGLTATTRDVITDFVRGQDKIDLSTIDANTALAGNQAFTGLIGANVAFTKAGQLRLNAGVLYGNTDADAAAEFSIALTGITTLANTDFVL